VVLNSAAWGQCDAIYAAFLLAGIGAQLRGHSGVAVLLAGCAFAVKLQAVFIAPWFVVLTLRRQLPVRTWLLAPLPYLAAVAPSWLLGRPFGELLMIYPDQADTYGQLTLHAPSVYAWLPLPDSFGRYGVAIGAVILGLAMLACWRRTGRDAEATVAMALFFVILVPWVLPHMHERYFYPADALSIAYAAGRPRMVLVPLLVVSASVFSYLPFLFGVELVPLWFNAGLMAAALVIVAWDTLALPRPPAFAVGARRRLAGEPSA
jgi:Gpi18-like mannosyltransferase